jgi:hypothetical protein
MPSPLLKDPFQTKRAIARQQEKLRKEMKDLVKMKATGSKYGALKRPQKRQAEYHHDRMTEEKSLQEDLRRAETMGKRIAQVLEQLRKDFNKMKNFAGNYNFANTVGMDSEASGICQTDLSTAIDTRAAWKRELENMLEMTWHYVDAQYLGDYAVLHTVPTASNNAMCGSSAVATSCCPLVYRPAFHYITPAGDCLSMPASAGSASGDSSAVDGGDIIDSGRDGASIEATPSDETAKDKTAVSPAAEQGLASPSARNHSQVSNCNLALRNVHRLLVNADEPVWVSYISNEIATAVATTGTNSYETATSTDGGVTEAARIAFLETYLESTTCLPAEMVEQISADSADLAAWTSIASVSAAALAHAPTVSNVEDESDLQFIFKMLTERMEKIRTCQLMNDREQQRIQYVRETSECNQAFHQVEFDRLTGFNDAEVDARYAAGAQMAADLDALKGQHSVTKQTFFNDITLKGCCW